MQIPRVFPLQPRHNTLKLVDDNNIERKEKEEEENFSYATQLVYSSILPMSLKSAIELGVFNIMAKAGDGAKLSALEIEAQMPTNNPDAAIMVDRILRMLASHSVIGCSIAGDGNYNENKYSNLQRLYSLNSVSKYFVIVDVFLSTTISVQND